MHFSNILTTSLLALASLAFGCRRPSIASDTRDVYESFGLKKPPTTITLFHLSDSVRGKIPPEKLQAFLQAQQDVNLILSGQKPIWSQYGADFTDGGTREYTSGDYIITHWKQHRTINDISCFRVGISVKFNSHISGDNYPLDDISQTWIEFLLD